MERASKKRKLEAAATDRVESTSSIETDKTSTDKSASISRPHSLTRSISPPLSRRSTPAIAEMPSSTNSEDPTFPQSTAKIIASPIHLSHVEGLAASHNVDALRLRDIIGDPLIEECWVFNYLFDVEFLMNNFDEDVRGIIKIKLVHGSWKKEDPNKIHIDDATRKYSNIESIAAYMPEMFGTHHTKMIILFRHDGFAQVIILTANILERDWKMTQAIWRSPLLLISPDPSMESRKPSPLPELGSGRRFKWDLIAYLKSYGRPKIEALAQKLCLYDFSSVRGALIASTPQKLNLRTTDPENETLWGWPSLQHVLRHIHASSSTTSRIVIQVSSVASLGSGNSWMKDTFLKSLAASKKDHSTKAFLQQPKYSLIFPTADEIRRSVDGYGSGGSIHMKTQSTAQARQLQDIRPMLCHWAGDSQNTQSSEPQPLIREAGRKRAAPHIKTYIRFRDNAMEHIDWAMVTSANLSMQAWGYGSNANNEVRICSYEIGVIVWPGLWDSASGTESNAGHASEANTRGTVMIPVFGADLPSRGDVARNVQGKDKGPVTVVGFRMPYDLPLVPYSANEMPWCATAKDDTPDWMGRIWPGY